MFQPNILTKQLQAMIPNYILSNTNDSLLTLTDGSVDENITDDTSSLSNQSSFAICSTDVCPNSISNENVSVCGIGQKSPKKNDSKCVDAETVTNAAKHRIDDGRTMADDQQYIPIDFDDQQDNPSIDNLEATEYVAVEQKNDVDLDPLTRPTMLDRSLKDAIIVDNINLSEISLASTIATLPKVANVPMTSNTPSSSSDVSITVTDIVFETVQCDNKSRDEQPIIGDGITTSIKCQQRSNPMASAPPSEVNTVVVGQSSANGSHSRNKIRVRDINKMRFQSQRKPKASKSPPSNRVAGMPDRYVNMAPLPPLPIVRLITTAGGVIDRRTNRAYLPMKSGSYHGIPLKTVQLLPTSPFASNNVSASLTPVLTTSPTNSIGFGHGMQTPEIRSMLTCTVATTPQLPADISTASSSGTLTSVNFAAITTDINTKTTPTHMQQTLQLPSARLPATTSQSSIPSMLQLPPPPPLLPLSPALSVQMATSMPQPIAATYAVDSNGTIIGDKMPTTNTKGVSISTNQFNPNAGPKSMLLHKELTAV